MKFSTINFASRHIGIRDNDLPHMFKTIGVNSLDQLIEETVPSQIRLQEELVLDSPLSEYAYLDHVLQLSQKNFRYKSFIGQGYYGTITPPVIQRNIFQNPGWYTQYTPYQAEIAQGRLEALLNFQTVVSELTAMPLANASLLDEATAAAEAMSMFYGLKNKKKGSNFTKLFVDSNTFKQTKDVLHTRANPLGIEIVEGDYRTINLNEDYFGAIVQYPNAEGGIDDYKAFIEDCNEKQVFVGVAADILALVLLDSPGEWGADVVFGSTQRLGIPLGFGGPHAAYFATVEKYKRSIPGRVIGVSQDRLGQKALRMALQTREQHIKREKATSNICTAQALLAIMAGMYAVYHGAEGLREIAQNIHNKVARLNHGLISLGIKVKHHHFFDTLALDIDFASSEILRKIALKHKMNFYYGEGVQISLDQTSSDEDVDAILAVFESYVGAKADGGFSKKTSHLPNTLLKGKEILEHPVFNSYRSETQLMRYIKRLENKDLSLVHAMIPLGSCTMKLNAAAELMPVSLTGFSQLHPFTPSYQCVGYMEMFDQLSSDLCKITGFTACSLQPNSGAQGEYAGLLTIKAYHEHRGDHHRNIAIIPSSAHGTNPASAVMAGMKVVIVKCDERGNIDIEDLKAKAEEHKENLASLMVTYPSTHGVFEAEIQSFCQIIHDFGGMVYMDGANMNAQVGLTSPARIGADVCHLNLHKTFAIPHGGGGPGMGPICCNDKLKPFLPGHFYKGNSDRAVSAAPWGSASILLISYGYIKLLGSQGVTDSSKYAILNANYIKSRLEDHYSVLYTGDQGRAAHELIIDLRMLKPLDIGAEDVAKRLIDYGFHAPTMSFPVPGTIMIEPTESEDLAELDRFCEAMIHIRQEIDGIADGSLDKDDNVLNNAPHTLGEITDNEWNHAYTREAAAYPQEYLKQTNKFWPAVSRVDNAFGDRNLICTCPPIEAYES